MRLDEMSNSLELAEFSELGISLADTNESINIYIYEKERYSDDC